MKVTRQNFITRMDIKMNPDKLYVFGDNIERTGYGGQAAEMRGELNSFGIATKVPPRSQDRREYFDDANHYHWCVVKEEFECLKRFAVNYKEIVIPEMGIGKGLARLDIYAPRILQFIENKFKEIETW